MQDPPFSNSPSDPVPDLPLRPNPHIAIVTVGALAAGAMFTAVVFVLVHAVKDAVAFISEYWPWIVGAAALVSLLALLVAVADVLDKYQAEQREARLREIAHLERVDVMSGDEFEAFTADLLRRDGFRSVHVIGRSGDRGVDVLAVSAGGDRIAVQCKRQKKTVGADRIRNLIGAVHTTYSGHIGVLVTNSTFTKQALEEAEGHLILLNRDQLTRWMEGETLIAR